MRSGATAGSMAHCGEPSTSCAGSASSRGVDTLELFRLADTDSDGVVDRRGAHALLALSGLKPDAIEEILEITADEGKLTVSQFPVALRLAALAQVRQGALSCLSEAGEYPAPACVPAMPIFIGLDAYVAAAQHAGCGSSAALYSPCPSPRGVLLNGLSGNIGHSSSNSISHTTSSGGGSSKLSSSCQLDADAHGGASSHAPSSPPPSLLAEHSTAGSSWSDGGGVPQLPLPVAPGSPHRLSPFAIRGSHPPIIASPVKPGTVSRTVAHFDRLSSRACTHSGGRMPILDSWPSPCACMECDGQPLNASGIGRHPPAVRRAASARLLQHAHAHAQHPLCALDSGELVQRRSVPVPGSAPPPAGSSRSARSKAYAALDLIASYAPCYCGSVSPRVSGTFEVQDCEVFVPSSSCEAEQSDGYESASSVHAAAYEDTGAVVAAVPQPEASEDGGVLLGSTTSTPPQVTCPPEQKDPTYGAATWPTPPTSTPPRNSMPRSIMKRFGQMLARKGDRDACQA